jgi:hypothetical protein
MAKKKSDVRRAIEIKGTDIVLELSKASAIQGKKRMIHLDELEDGTWRLIFSKDLVSDFSEIESLNIIREEIK